MSDSFRQYNPLEHSFRSHPSNHRLSPNASSRDPAHSTVSIVDPLQQSPDAAFSPLEPSQRSELQHRPLQLVHFPPIVLHPSQPKDGNYPHVTSTEASLPPLGDIPDAYRDAEPAFRRKTKVIPKGTLVPISNIVRDKARNEARLKRARREENTNESVDGLCDMGDDESQSKKFKRGEYSCDQCYNRKIRVSISAVRSF